MVAQATLVKLALAGGVALAGYELAWKPYIARKKTEADLINAAKAKGGNLEDALKGLGKAACQAYAASNGMKPDASSSLCDALTTIGDAALKYGAKYAVKGGKVVGHEAAVIGKDVGKGAKAVGNAVGGAGKKVASVASHLKFWGLEGLHC